MSTKNKPRLIGYVTSVNILPEFREVRVDVIVGHDRELENVEMLNPQNSAIHVPKVGDFVIVDYIEGKYVAGLATDPVEHFTPELSHGDICFNPDQRTWLHFKNNWESVEGEKRAVNSVDVDLAASGSIRFSILDETQGHIENSEDVDPEENSYFEFIRNEDGSVDLDINVTGSININSTENIVVGNGEGAEPLAKQDHTHEYWWGNEGGSSVTPPPVEEGTDTLIE